jgi:hypothetical protein
VNSEAGEGFAMDEAEWLACSDPKEILEFLHGKASNRKLRLFACGVWRRTVERSPGSAAGYLRLLDVAERYSDGAVSQAELIRSRGSPEASGSAF